MAEPLAPILKGALDVIRHHHEKLDGSGYPDGLKGADISPVARIMAVADIYDALVTDRPYRRGMTKEEALATLQREAAQGLLDAAAVSHLDGPHAERGRKRSGRRMTLKFHKNCLPAAVVLCGAAPLRVPVRVMRSWRRPRGIDRPCLMDSAFRRSSASPASWPNTSSPTPTG